MNTREKEAIADLLRRANTRTAAHHSHNTQGAARCLRCGTGARIGEMATPAHVFCSSDCQRQLHGLWHFFQLSGNDDPQSGHKRLLEVEPEGGWPLWMPDEILCALVLLAFGAELRLHAFTALMALRTVSQQFARVIDACVVPRLEKIPADALDSLSFEQLLRFRGLTHLRLESWRLYDEEAARLLSGLPALTALRIDLEHLGEWGGEATQALSRCTALRKLRLDGFGWLGKKALLPLTELRTLRLYETRQAFKLHTLSNLTELVVKRDGLYNGWEDELMPVDTFALYLTNLHTLRLPHYQYVAGVEHLTALHTLEMDEDRQGFLTGDKLVQLSQLTDLTLSPSSVLLDEALRRATQLRVLDIGHCDWFTERGIETLRALQRLVIADPGAIDEDRAHQLLPDCVVDVRQDY